jgi:hypothetical protein
MSDSVRTYCLPRMHEILARLDHAADDEVDLQVVDDLRTIATVIETIPRPRLQLIEDTG